MKKQHALLSLAVIASSLLAVSADAQLVPGEDYSTHSDPANSAISQRWKRDAAGEPYYASDVYSYTAVSGSGSIALRNDGSNANNTETGLGRKMNAPIFFFQLPELGGLSIGNASLTFSVLSQATTTGTGNVDLWGLGFITESPGTLFPPSPTIGSRITNDELAVVLEDPAQIRANELGPLFFHNSDTDGRPGLGISEVVRIQDDIIDFESPAAANDRISTNAEGSAALDVFLSSLYSEGAQAGDWAVFRLSYDVEVDPSGGFTGYSIYGSTADGADTDPTLSFTAIPEPSTVVLFSGVAALAVTGLIRRRSKS